MIKKLYIFCSFLFFFIFCSEYSFALECIDAYDFDDSQTFDLIVEANPNLTSDNGYNHNTSSQKAVWKDSKVYTSTSGPFEFVISGSWTPWYGVSFTPNDKVLKAEPGSLCLYQSVNDYSEKFGLELGEFEYIKTFSSWKKIGNIWVERVLDPIKQKPCYLNGGDGLYVAAFGKTGNKLPTVATHLKTARVKCPALYASDKNGDGLFTFDECYDLNDRSKKNKSYYENYISGNIKSYVDCEEEYFYGDDPTRVGVNDCYYREKQKDGTFALIDKTRFHFLIDTLYTDTKYTKIPVGQNLKFLIYDRYYADNVGEYHIKMYRGVSDQVDYGLIQKILSDIEKMFVGSRDSYGNRTNGLLYSFYHYIILDTNFAFIVRIFLILYMTFLGFQFALGSLQYSTKQLMTILLKLTFVISFTTATSWTTYDYFVVRFFLDGFDSIVTAIGNICRTFFETSGTTASSKFAFMDDLARFAFSANNTKKIQGLFFGSAVGWLVIPLYYYLACYFVITLLDATFPYIISFIQMVVALAIGPIFICLFLFETTKQLFNNWLQYIAGRAINMTFLFAFIYMFGSIIREQFEKILKFKVCKISFWDAMIYKGQGDRGSEINNFFSLGIKVWDYVDDGVNKLMSEGELLVQILFIYILIKLFSYLVQQIPSIADGLVEIGGVGGGKAGGGGGSKVSGKLGSSFLDNIDNAIQIEAWNSKEGKFETKGLVSRIKGYVGPNAILGHILNGGTNALKEGGKLLSALDERIKERAGDIKEQVNTNKLIDNIEKSGLTGSSAISKAVEDYDKQLKELKLDGKTDTVQNKAYKKALEDFKQKAEDKFINDPLKKQLENFNKYYGKNGDTETTNRLLNSFMDNFKKNYSKEDQELIDKKLKSHPIYKSIMFASKDKKRKSFANDEHFIKNTSLDIRKKTLFGEYGGNDSNFENLMNKKINGLKGDPDKKLELSKAQKDLDEYKKIKEEETKLLEDEKNKDNTQVQGNLGIGGKINVNEAENENLSGLGKTDLSMGNAKLKMDVGGADANQPVESSQDKVQEMQKKSNEIKEKITKAEIEKEKYNLSKVGKDTSETLENLEEEQKKQKIREMRMNKK